MNRHKNRRTAVTTFSVTAVVVCAVYTFIKSGQPSHQAFPQTHYDVHTQYNDVHTKHNDVPITYNVTSPHHTEMHTNSAEPIQHVAFLKVHKAASTTVQNIFYRYGLKHDLIFALPKSTTGFPRKLEITEDRFIPPPKRGLYDILCVHVTYNRKVFAKILPTDTKYVGIIREPFRQFESSIHYYHSKLMLSIPGPNPLHTYLSDYKYINNQKGQLNMFNKMSFDLGFPHQLFFTNDKRGIAKYLRKLDKEIDLVMIVEYFDESIVLMRRLLHWDLQDVIYAKLNPKKVKDPRLHFGQKEETLYKTKSILDYALYDFFLKKLLDNIRKQPSDFHDEVAYLKIVRSRYNEFCLSSITEDNGRKHISIEESPWNKQFEVTTDTCRLLLKPERAFYKQLKSKMEILTTASYRTKPL